MSTQAKVLVECEICGGFGVLAAELGMGVVCARCGGNGGHELAYTPFKGLRKRQGIRRVRRAGRYHLSAPADGKKTAMDGIPYADFMKGKRP